MKVKVYPFRDGIGYGNIMWNGPRFEMRGGKFPKEHPVGGGFGDQCGDGANIKAFRKLGYWASCFPEGDGITWKPLNGQSDEQCMEDIKASFGWEVAWCIPINTKTDGA